MSWIKAQTHTPGEKAPELNSLPGASVQEESFEDRLLEMNVTVVIILVIPTVFALIWGYL